MTFKTCIIASLLLLPDMLLAQTNLRLHPMVHLPQDSVTSAALITALDGFLGSKELPNNQNPFILPEDLLATSVLVDELKQIERNDRLKDSSFYKCCLLNIVPEHKAGFLVQLAWMGVKDGQPYLRGSFKLIAKQTNKGFFFSSPLNAESRRWKTKTIAPYTFYYQRSLDVAQANAYVAATIFYDKKLMVKTGPKKCYYCDSAPDALSALGVDYKLDYNGYASISLSGTERDTALVVESKDATGKYFDPHDLWHARLRKALPGAAINKPVDEGCAFLYGGSWGLTWPQIYQMFMDKVASKPDADWLSLYESDVDFGNDKAKPLQVSYAINALIVQKLEKEMGFSAVKTLLICGRYEKTNLQYFKTLEQLTGINRTNFNTRIAGLIKESRKV